MIRGVNECGNRVVVTQDFYDPRKHVVGIQDRIVVTVLKSDPRQDVSAIVTEYGDEFLECRRVTIIVIEVAAHHVQDNEKVSLGIVDHVMQWPQKNFVQAACIAQ